MIIDWEELLSSDEIWGTLKTIVLVVTYYTGQELALKQRIHDSILAGKFKCPQGLNAKGVSLFSRILVRGVKTLMGEEAEGVYLSTGEYGSIEGRPGYDPLAVKQQGHILDVQESLTAVTRARRLMRAWCGPVFLKHTLGGRRPMKFWLIPNMYVNKNPKSRDVTATLFWLFRCLRS